MRPLFFLAIAGLFSISLNAQDKTSTTKATREQTGKTNTEKKYWCSECDYSSLKSGICQTHKSALVREGLYFCFGDETNASSADGKCKDGTLKIKMDETMIMKNKEAVNEKMKKEKMNEQK